MSHAYKNLADNNFYLQHQRSIIGKTEYTDGEIVFKNSDEATRAEACYYCHGTKLKVTGKEIRDTEAFGELEFPVIEGWPNQGVGRVNPDASLGSCSACHTRHAFSIEMARKPYTCKECHVGPDVPAFKVYAASKHGNIFSSKHATWDFKAVPWTIGKDFTAPTCATCHVSLLVNTDEAVVVERTHQMNNRLPWRILGLIYAHPHPAEPNTSIIRNKDGLAVDYEVQGDFPVYGNNDDAADAFAVDLVKRFMDKLRRQPTYRNAVPTQAVLTITSNVVYGKKTGSTPDGRKAGAPFAPGANPTHGRDTKGAVASMASVAKLPYAHSQDGISYTFSIVPKALGKTQPDQIANLGSLLDGYFAEKGHHINVNIFEKETLLDAMEHPEKYPQLTIRVSGYAVNFIKLTREQQLDVINRTFHERM